MDNYKSKHFGSEVDQGIDDIKKLVKESVRTIPQNLSDSEKKTVLENLGITNPGGTDITDAVRYSPQMLNSHEKQIARDNINAISKTEAQNLVPDNSEQVLQNTHDIQELKRQLEELPGQVQADEEDIHQETGENGVVTISFKNRVTDNGKGYIILRDNANHSLTSADFTQDHTIYEIRYNFDLHSNTLELPVGCELRFNGGSLSNGTIQGNKTTISANLYHIFYNITLSGTFLLQYLQVEWFGVFPDGTDCSDNIQTVCDNAYYITAGIHFNVGRYVFTRCFYIYDGAVVKGEGILNTVLCTPWAKNTTAKKHASKTKKKWNIGYTDSEMNDHPELDMINGHNRFYLGDGVVGYYDHDRSVNPNHPLYWNDDTPEFHKWEIELAKIESTGRWVGKTGREGYAKGLIKSSQKPGIYYDGSIHTHPYGICHTGIRNVKITDLEITTNSIDRGKDSAINFRYEANDIPSAVRDTYDSSVLNIYLANLYLFGLGGSGYEATRAVMNVIENVYCRQNAVYGIYLMGVTSCSIRGCYANSCLEAGYKLKGVNYSSIQSCAAYSCCIAYSLDNCNAVSLISCGAEACRYMMGYDVAVDGGIEEIYKGFSYNIRNCQDIQLISCFASAARTKYVEKDIDMDPGEGDELDDHFFKNRYIRVFNSQNVSIEHPFLKSYSRIRSQPYRDPDTNAKINKDFGPYDPSTKGSRYWQMQSFTTGAAVEVVGVDSRVKIINDKTQSSLEKELQVRFNNLDILDPGTVPNPLGYNTAGKTVKGSDGNGGWIYTKNLSDFTGDDGSGYVGSDVNNYIEELLNTICTNERYSTNRLDEIFTENPQGWRAIINGSVAQFINVLNYDPSNDKLYSVLYYDSSNSAWYLDLLAHSNFSVNTDNLNITMHVSLDTFEAIFPMNGKKVGLARTALWNWRDSLLLVRIKTDKTYERLNGGQGLQNVLGVIVNDDGTYANNVNWTSALADKTNFVKYNIDLVTQYKDSSLIDGSDEYFSYGKFFSSPNPNKYIYPQKIFTSIPGYVNYTETGAFRTWLNVREPSNIPNNARKSALMIYSEDDDASGILSLVADRSLKGLRINKDENNPTDTGEPFPYIQVTDVKGNNYFKVTNDETGAIQFGNKKLISLDPNSFENIPYAVSGANNEILVKRVNQLIKRLTRHGFNSAPENEVDVEISSVAINRPLQVGLDITIRSSALLYGCGMAYIAVDAETDDGTNEYTPNAANNSKKESNFISSSNNGTIYESVIKRDNTKNYYCRAYVYTGSDTGLDENRKYSDTVIKISKFAFNIIQTIKETHTKNEIQVNLSVTSNCELFGAGIAYSKINSNPTANQNKLNGDFSFDKSTGVGSMNVTIPRDQLKPTYLRPYVYYKENLTEDSSRWYGDVTTVAADDIKVAFSTKVTSTTNSVSVISNITSNITLYGYGLAWSKTTENPTANSNSAAGSLSMNQGSVTIKRDSLSDLYVRPFVYKGPDSLEANRIYDVAVRIPADAINAEFIVTKEISETEIRLRISVKTDFTIYGVGAAYSSTTQNPTANSNHIDSVDLNNPYELVIPRKRISTYYIRPYFYKGEALEEGNRFYGDQIIIDATTAEVVFNLTYQTNTNNVVITARPTCNVSMYGFGVAYSKTNTNPDKDSTKEQVLGTNGPYEVTIARSPRSPLYFKPYLYVNADTSSDSSRFWDTNVVTIDATTAEVTFNITKIVTNNNVHVTCKPISNIPLYGFGVIYSSTNSNPGSDSTRIDSSDVITPFELDIPRTYNKALYFKPFVYINDDKTSDSNRYYDSKVITVDPTTLVININASAEVTSTLINVTARPESNVPIYGFGVAYSKTNSEPTTNDNSIESDDTSSPYSLAIKRDYTALIYIRPYVYTSNVKGSSSRVYGEVQTIDSTEVVISFSNSKQLTEGSVILNSSISSTVPIYGYGVAYSTSSNNPVANRDSKVNGSYGNGVGMVVVPRTSLKKNLYIRPFVYLSSDTSSEDNRYYGDTVTINADAIIPEVTFSTVESHTSISATISSAFQSNVAIYGYGVAYSTTNNTPTANSDSKINGTLNTGNKSGSATIDRNQDKVLYMRAFVYIDKDTNAEASRYYDSKVIRIDREDTLINFNSTESHTASDINVSSTITANIKVYGFGLAYSTTNSKPTANGDSKVNGVYANSVGIGSVPRDPDKVTYVRPFIYLDRDASVEANRYYSNDVITVAAQEVPTFSTSYVVSDDKVTITLTPTFSGKILRVGAFSGSSKELTELDDHEGNTLSTSKVAPYIIEVPRNKSISLRIRPYIVVSDDSENDRYCLDELISVNKDTVITFDSTETHTDTQINIISNISSNVNINGFCVVYSKTNSNPTSNTGTKVVGSLDSTRTQGTVSVTRDKKSNYYVRPYVYTSVTDSGESTRFYGRTIKIDAQEIIFPKVSFENSEVHTDNQVDITSSISTNIDIYGYGAAYSTSNPIPTAKNDSKVNGVLSSDGNRGSASVPRNKLLDLYIRPFVYKDTDTSSESNRIYSDKVIIVRSTQVIPEITFRTTENHSDGTIEITSAITSNVTLYGFGIAYSGKIANPTILNNKKDGTLSNGTGTATINWDMTRTLYVRAFVYTKSNKTTVTYDDDVKIISAATITFDSVYQPTESSVDVTTNIASNVLTYGFGCAYSSTVEKPTAPDGKLDGILNDNVGSVVVPRNKSKDLYIRPYVYIKSDKTSDASRIYSSDIEHIAPDAVTPTATIRSNMIVSEGLITIDGTFTSNVYLYGFGAAYSNTNNNPTAANNSLVNGTMNAGNTEGTVVIPRDYLKTYYIRPFVYIADNLIESNRIYGDLLTAGALTPTGVTTLRIDIKLSDKFVVSCSYSLDVTIVAYGVVYSTTDNNPTYSNSANVTRTGAPGTSPVTFEIPRDATKSYNIRPYMAYKSNDSESNRIYGSTSIESFDRVISFNIVNQEVTDTEVTYIVTYNLAVPSDPEFHGINACYSQSNSVPTGFSSTKISAISSDNNQYKFIIPRDRTRVLYVRFYGYYGNTTDNTENQRFYDSNGVRSVIAKVDSVSFNSRVLPDATDNNNYALIETVLTSNVEISSVKIYYSTTNENPSTNDSVVNASLSTNKTYSARLLKDDLNTIYAKFIVVANNKEFSDTNVLHISKKVPVLDWEYNTFNYYNYIQQGITLRSSNVSVSKIGCAYGVNKNPIYATGHTDESTSTSLTVKVDKDPWKPLHLRAYALIGTEPLETNRVYGYDFSFDTSIGLFNVVLSDYSDDSTHEIVTVIVSWKYNNIINPYGFGVVYSKSDKIPIRGTNSEKFVKLTPEMIELGTRQATFTLTKNAGDDIYLRAFALITDNDNAYNTVYGYLIGHIGPTNIDKFTIGIWDKSVIDADTSTAIFANISLTSSVKIYGFGAAYSSSNISPTANQNKVDGTFDGLGAVTIPRKSGKIRYVRFYVYTGTTNDASCRYYLDRIYSIQDTDIRVIQENAPQPS